MMNELMIGFIIFEMRIHCKNQIFDEEINLKLSFSQKDDAESSYDGYYEDYCDQNIPDGYTAYGQNCNTNDEAEYDRYEYDYAKSPSDKRPERDSCERLKSCCSDMGRLLQF